MSLRCRFANCQWTGTEENIFAHLENKHRRNIRDPSGKNYYDLVINDLEEKILVLVSNEGLYWLCQNPLTIL